MNNVARWVAETNGRYFAEDILELILLNEIFYMFIRCDSMKIVC